jgi:hypothetical protein
VKCPLSPGAQVWTATGLAILAVDILGETTLSESFNTFSRTPHGRIVTTAGWLYLTAHMFGMIPSKRDPLVLAFSRVPKRKKVGIVVV